MFRLWGESWTRLCLQRCAARKPDHPSILILLGLGQASNRWQAAVGDERRCRSQPGHARVPVDNTGYDVAGIRRDRDLRNVRHLDARILPGEALFQAFLYRPLTIRRVQLGSVGVIVPSMEVKLQDYPEAGYLTSNSPAQGEVWLRGGSVTKGYYKRPDLNKESFTDDGWFKTGDIGQFAADGTLSLIDRIKNLVKLRSGEYLALEKLESVYGSCDISQNLCVYANAEADKPIAIVFPVSRLAMASDVFAYPLVLARRQPAQPPQVCQHWLSRRPA